MSDIEEQERKAQPLRKRKACVQFEEIFYSDSSDSSDCYDPAKDLEDDTSDDSVYKIKRSVKKKKKMNHNDDELISDNDSEDETSKGCIRKVKSKVNKNVKKKTNNNGAPEKARGKKSKHRGRHPLNKSAVKKMEKMIEVAHDKGRKTEKKKKGQQVQEIRSDRARVGPYSVVGHWYIASGFMKDLTTLFEAFDEQDSWRFTAFAECWQKSQFSLIYRGRYSFKELLEFSQEICLWTKKFLSPIHSLKWRVGALYALYGLFYKHPFRHLYKIRMEMKAYENMVSLVRNFHSNTENPDPAYIFYKLTADGAFHHVASSNEMGLHFHCAERQWETMNYEMQWVLKEHSSESVFPEHKCNIQKTLIEEYQKVKTQIWGNDSKELDKAMSYVQPNILSEVRSDLAELHQDDSGQTATSNQASRDVNQSHTSSTEVSEIGQRVNEIRLKAAASCTTNDFLQRKLLRSPQKNTKAGDVQHNSESVTGSVSDIDADNLNVLDDKEKIRTLRKIMEFMQPPEEGTLNIPLRSLRTKKNKKVQNQIKEESDSQFDNVCEIFDSQDANSSPEELTTSQSQQPSRQRRGRRKKTDFAQMALQSKKSHVKNKPRETSLPKQEKRSKNPKKSNLRNSSKCESHDNSQINEVNEIMERESELENLTDEEVMINNTSVSKKQVALQSHIKKKVNEKVLQNKQCPLENKQSRSQNTPNQGNLATKCINKSTKLIPCNIEETTSAAADKENKNLCENFCELNYEQEAVANEHVDEGFDNQTIASKNVHEESLSDESVTAATNIPNVSDDNTNFTYIESEQNSVSASDINDMGSRENSTQINFSDMNNVGRMLQVEILATMPKKRSLQSTLKAKSMVYILVNFQIDNVKVHTVKFKMSKTDLKIIQSNRDKLNVLKKRLHSLLPSKYKNYDLHLQLNIHQSVMEETETSGKKHFTHRFEPLRGDNFEQDYNPPEIYKQGSQASGTLNKSDNAVPHEEPMTSCTQKENVSSLMTEDYNIPSSLSPEVSDDMNHVRKVIQVEMVANVEENYVGAENKTENTTTLNVNFQVEGITVHHAKFQISIKDLETLLNNKNKLESLMEKFRSFLPPRYKMYEIQLHSSVQQSVTEGSIVALQHSRQGSDPPAILPYAAATPFKGNNAILNREEASTSPSQESLSKKLTNSHSESSPAQVPQLSNVGEIKQYHSLRPADLGQYNTNTVAQPTCLTLDTQCLQRTTESSVNLLINEGSQHPESCTILRSSNEDIHVSNIPPKLRSNNEINIFSSPKCCVSENQNPPYVAGASLEDSDRVMTQYQILPCEIVPTTYGESKPDRMLMDEQVTPQVYGMHTECPAKLPDFERPIVTAHVDDGLENSGHDFINNSLQSHNSFDMHFNPNTNEINKNASLLKECTNDLDTETCTILWKTRNSLDTMGDKNHLPSLPFSDSSSEYIKMIREGQRKAVTKTMRNVDHGEALLSSSRSSDTSMKDISLLASPSHSPSRIISGNLMKSDRAVSKANDNTVCSFYFFSKTKKYDSSLKKQTRPSSESDIKKPSVKFLFMEKLFSKKKQ
ncbi:uncharacterized protein LOC135106404 isoform X1 [Scylla paramamosain]|uniref:uncharacterized protein LOC135106404 isoform X1 n=1 Tax=Scylla paramamosain TaxID=85552 RepID=UPI003082B71C